ncbi:hypothetical protein ES702_02502 [subsurface metagenome]
MFRSVDYTATYYQGCDHGCPWCWTLFQRGPISHEPRLLQRDEYQLLKEREACIFLNSAHDSFALCIPTDWILQMLRWIGRQHPSLEFYLQSQAVERTLNEEVILEQLLQVRDRVIIGTTIQTDREDIIRMFSEAPSISRRYQAMLKFKELGFRLRLSLEPLFDFNYAKLADIVLNIGPELVEIGLDNYAHRHKLDIPQPDYMGFRFLVDDMKGAGIRVCEKRSMKKWREGKSSRSDVIL